MLGADQCPLFRVERCLFLGGSKCISFYGKINQRQVSCPLYRGCQLYGGWLLEAAVTLSMGRVQISPTVGGCSASNSQVIPTLPLVIIYYIGVVGENIDRCITPHFMIFIPA